VVELWDIATQSQITSLDTSILDVATVAFSPDGRSLADGGLKFAGGISGFTDGLELWDISTKYPTLLSSFPTLPAFGGVGSIAFSPDGSTLFAGALAGLSAFNVSTSALLASYPGSGTVPVAITPDGSRLAMLTRFGALAVASNPFSFSIPVTSIVLNPTSVVGEYPSTGTVTLSEPAPPSGFAVKLTSNSPSATVPEFVEFPGGATTATFNVTTTGVAKQTAAVITAGAGSLSQSATLTINPAGLYSMWVGPTSNEGGEQTIGEALLSGFAPSGGTVVSLKSDNKVASVPATVIIPAGQDIVSFNIATAGVKVMTTVTITGSYDGVTRKASFVLYPNTINSLGINPWPVTGGNPCTGVFTIYGTAPTGGQIVKIVSNSPAVIVPESVVIPGGKSSGTFSVRTLPVASQVNATVTLTCGGISPTCQVLVNPAALASLSLNPTSVSGGKESVGTVKIGSPAPRGGLVISLSSSVSSASLPKSVTIPAGATSATFTIRTTKVSSTTSAAITATANGASKSATLTIT
jgi:hypothetical protein